MATTLKEARRIAKTYGVNALLTAADANPKLAKNIGIKALTRPLHFAPFKLSGWNVCPMATAGCAKACLHTAGNPIYMNAKEKARLARTTFFFRDREAFMTLLVHEIEKHVKDARKRRMICGVRLNATSDVRWEVYPVSRKGKTFANIMSAFPRVQFYDYTKIANRKHLPENYHLTFSLAENNDASALAAIKNRMNIAAVFDTPRGKPLPDFFNIMGKDVPVIDGDEHDFRPIDPKQVIIGLRAKGKARNDASGFVRKVHVS